MLGLLKVAVSFLAHYARMRLYPERLYTDQPKEEAPKQKVALPTLIPEPHP
jgi:hypothetical protein